jgi:HEAT repeat protein
MALGAWQHAAAPAVPALLKALEDTDPGVRGMAASAIYLLASADALPSSALPDLVRALPCAETQMVVVQVLGAATRLPPEAESAIVTALRQDTSATAGLLLQALNRLPALGSDTLALLREKAVDDGTTGRHAALALVCHGTPEDATKGLEILTKALASADTRPNAVYLLGEAGAKAAAADAALAPFLEPNVDEMQGWTQLSVAGALARIGGPSAARALDMLVAALRGDKMGQTGWAATALGRLPSLSRPALDALLDRLEPDGTDPSLCWTAARSLGRAAPNEPRVLARLAQAARIPENAPLRWAAAGALLHVAAR